MSMSSATTLARNWLRPKAKLAIEEQEEGDHLVLVTLGLAHCGAEGHERGADHGNDYAEPCEGGYDLREKDHREDGDEDGMRGGYGNDAGDVLGAHYPEHHRQIDAGEHA